jgi:hypothetical protein
MKLSYFFIDHPRFATVVNIFILVFGLAAAAFLPTAHRHRPDPMRRLRSVGLHLRHLGPVLQAIRNHHRCFHSNLVFRFPDLEPGALRGASEAAPRTR